VEDHSRPSGQAYGFDHVLTMAELNSYILQRPRMSHSWSAWVSCLGGRRGETVRLRQLVSHSPPRHSIAISRTLQRSTSLTPRGLTPRGLTPRGLTPRGLTPRGLTPRGLTPRGLTPAGLLPRSTTLTPAGLRGKLPSTRNPTKSRISPARIFSLFVA
jgi:hypothetical protein